MAVLMKSRLFDRREPMLALAGLLLVIFTGPLFLQYGVHNDYSTLAYPHNRCCLQFPETEHLFTVGRPLGAVLLNAHFLPLTSIGSFAWGRFGSFLVLAVTILISAQIFVKYIGVPPTHALLVNTLLLLLPSALLFVFWLTNFVPGTLNIALATVSYYLVARSYEGGRRGSALAGYGLLFLTFFIYPPSSYWFLIFTSSKVVFSKDVDWVRRRREVAGELASCIALSVGYFLVAKVTTPLLTKWAFGNYVPEHGAYEFAFAGSLGARVEVLKQYFALASTVWFPEFLAPGILLVASLAALVVACSLERTDIDRVRFRRSWWQRMGLVIGVALLSSGPATASAGGFASFRTVCATAGIVALLWVCAIIHLSSARSSPTFGAVLLVGLLAAASAAAAIRLNAAAFNANLECRYIRQKVAAFDGKVTQVLLRLPEPGDVIVDKPLMLEFRQMATNYFPMTGIVTAAMEERGLDAHGVAILAVPSDGKFTVKEAPGMGVIDMADAGFWRTSANTVKRQRIVLSQRPLSGCCSVMFAFDGDKNTFFEEDGGFPAELSISMPNGCQEVGEYGFTAHVVANRMPLAWKVYGRENRSGEWNLLDSREHVAAWTDFESRMYSIATPGCFSDYKIEILRGGDPRLLRIGEVVFRGKEFQSVEASGGPNGGIGNRIAASCTLEPFGPAGLLESSLTWHCKSPQYPELIWFDFGAPVRFSRLSLLPQSTRADRGPKDVVIEESPDGKKWQTVGNATAPCGLDSEVWRTLPLAKTVSTSHVRLKILSNCGAPDLLTLRGVRLE